MTGACSATPTTTGRRSLPSTPGVVGVTSRRGKTATVAALEFARALAREARKFADEMERMYAAQLADGTKAAGSDAA